MFTLTIASVSKAVFEGKVESVTVPGTDGEMTVLSHHQPTITTLKEGKIIVREDKDTIKEYPLKSGILEVARNRATVLL